jgi:hypothetical protein
MPRCMPRLIFALKHCSIPERQATGFQGCSLFVTKSQYLETTGYGMLRWMLRLLFFLIVVSWNNKLLDAEVYAKAALCIKITVSWNNRLLDAKAVVFLLKNSLYLGPIGYWMPRHMPIAVVCFVKKKLPHPWNDRLLYVAVYAKAVVCLKNRSILESVLADPVYLDQIRIRPLKKTGSRSELRL